MIRWIFGFIVHLTCMQKNSVWLILNRDNQGFCFHVQPGLCYKLHNCGSHNTSVTFHYYDYKWNMIINILNKADYYAHMKENPKQKKKPDPPSLLWLVISRGLRSHHPGWVINNCCLLFETTHSKIPLRLDTNGTI